MLLLTFFLARHFQEERERKFAFKIGSNSSLRSKLLTSLTPSRQLDAKSVKIKSFVMQNERLDKWELSYHISLVHVCVCRFFSIIAESHSFIHLFFPPSKSIQPKFSISWSPLSVSHKNLSKSRNLTAAFYDRRPSRLSFDHVSLVSLCSLTFGVVDMYTRFCMHTRKRWATLWMNGKFRTRTARRNGDIPWTLAQHTLERAWIQQVKFPSFLLLFACIFAS